MKPCNVCGGSDPVVCSECSVAVVGALQNLVVAMRDCRAARLYLGERMSVALNVAEKALRRADEHRPN